MTFNGVNPRKYEINALYDAFKDIFDNKEIIIKIINELFPEEEEDDKEIFSDFEDNIKFTKIIEISDINTIENLTSLEFEDIKDLELGEMNARIRNLKISGEDNGTIKVKFSLLNNLEALILYGNSKLDIYDLPNNNNDIYELRNLKYLHLSQFELPEKLNIEATIPNLIYFYLSFEDLNGPHSEDDSFYEKMMDEITDRPFEPEIGYFREFANLKYLHLYYELLKCNHGEVCSKTFICKKLENDIFKCHYIYMDDYERDYLQEELFYYNQKINKKYNIKLNVSLSDPENWNVFDFDEDYNNYEEFQFETKFNPLFDKNIKINNFSVKKIVR